MDCLPDCSLEFSDLAIGVSLCQTEYLEKEDPGVGAFKDYPLVFPGYKLTVPAFALVTIVYCCVLSFVFK